MKTKIYLYLQCFQVFKTSIWNKFTCKQKATIFRLKLFSSLRWITSSRLSTMEIPASHYALTSVQPSTP